MANIAILLQEYFPADVRVRKEVHALCEEGHQIDIFCLRGSDELAFETAGNVIIHRTLLSKKRGSKLRYITEYFIFFIRAYFWLRRLVSKNRVDVVHVHTLPDFLVFAVHFAKKKGAKVILDMHEITPEFFMSKYNITEKNIIIQILKWIERKSMEYADFVITVNKQIKDKFSKRAKVKNEIVVIMNTVDDIEFPRIPKKEHKKIIGVYHGTLTELYNLDFAINALKLIEDKLSNFEFHIYGSGTQLEKLKELVSMLGLMHIVFLHGRVNHTEIPEILSQADIGILPLRKDIMTDLSFSNKIAEYIHYSIPVLSSNLKGISEYFPENSVFYFRHNDIQDFNTNLLRIISEKDLRNEYAGRASAIYKTMGWDIMKARLKDLVLGIEKGNN